MAFVFKLMLTRLFCFLVVFSCVFFSSGQNQLNHSDTSQHYFKNLPLYIDSFSYDGTEAYLGRMGMGTNLTLINYSLLDSISANKYPNAVILPDTSFRNFEYQDDSFFVIKVDGEFRKYNKEYNLNSGHRNGFSWTEFRGYFTDLGWYVLHVATIGESMYLGFCEMVRKEDAKHYEIIGYSDAGTAGIALAPNMKALLIFDNAVYSDDCTVVLIGIDSVGGLVDFKTIGIQSFTKSVYGIIWPEMGNPILQFALTYKDGDRRDVSTFEYIELNISELLSK